MSSDQEQFFKALGTTAEQTVEHLRAIEENYFDMLKASPAFPWAESLSDKLQSHVDQNIAAALDFSRKLKEARDFQDFIRMQSEFLQAQFKSLSEQAKDIGEASTKAAADAMKTKVPFNRSS